MISLTEEGMAAETLRLRRRWVVKCESTTVCSSYKTRQNINVQEHGSDLRAGRLVLDPQISRKGPLRSRTHLFQGERVKSSV